MATKYLTLIWQQSLTPHCTVKTLRIYGQQRNRCKEELPKAMDLIHVDILVLTLFDSRGACCLTIQTTYQTCSAGSLSVLLERSARCEVMKIGLLFCFTLRRGATA